MKFTVLVERADEGGYGAFCPDVPGCISCGDTAEEALALFKEGLEGLLKLIRKEGGELPRSSLVACTVEVDDVA